MSKFNNEEAHQQLVDALETGMKELRQENKKIYTLIHTVIHEIASLESRITKNNEEQLAIMDENPILKKKKTKRDPDAPKKNKNLFEHFKLEIGAGLKSNEKTSGLTWIEQQKELGRIWREDYPTEEDRTKWKHLADEDRTRYNTEVALYKNK